MPPPCTNLTKKFDRFSLLLLEPGEIYFKDVAVIYCSDPDSRTQPGRRGSSVKTIQGWLKICSKSLVFVPTDSSDPVLPDSRPLVKLPLADCTSIKGKACHRISVQQIKTLCFSEWLPKSFQSFFANKSNTFSITCKSKVEMLKDNKVAPFKFSKIEPVVPFVFSLCHSRLDDELPLMAQLQRAATLPAVEQHGMIATMVYSTQNRTDFDHCWLESIHERILLKVSASGVSGLLEDCNFCRKNFTKRDRIISNNR